MNGKFKNKYRIASARAPWWDYGSDGAYFITICTKNRYHHFGAVDRGGIMHLSAIGKIAQQEWIKTPGVRPDMDLTLGEFVVMHSMPGRTIFMVLSSLVISVPIRVETRCIHRGRGASLRESERGI